MATVKLRTSDVTTSSPLLVCTSHVYSSPSTVALPSSADAFQLAVPASTSARVSRCDATASPLVALRTTTVRLCVPAPDSTHGKPSATVAASHENTTSLLVFAPASGLTRPTRLGASHR